jgi:selenocysteine-specific elongation factor
LRILEREGIVVQVEPERFYDAGVVAGMMQQLRDGMRDGATYAPAQLRELLGVSRKYLMPFLEYCDRRHVTERHENGRVLARQEAR